MPVDFSQVLLYNVFRTDFLARKVKSPAKQAILDQIFSRTILVGQDACTLSYSDLNALTGMAIKTISRALKELILKDRLVILQGAYGPRVAQTYRLNIQIPVKAEQAFSIQRDPWLLVASVMGTTTEPGIEKLDLTPEGQAVIETIKQSLKRSEYGVYRRRAYQLLSSRGQAPTEATIEEAINELILDNFSDEKRLLYARRA
jgi:DNA-binding MarR family transcriptional regulator